MNLKKKRTRYLSISTIHRKRRQQKEIKEILAEEIKEYQAKWKQYSNTKPLPALPKTQNAIKTLGNKLKTQFYQVVKPKEYLKPINGNGSNFLTLLMTTGLVF